jgi:hypothetical protein
MEMTVTLKAEVKLDPPSLTHILVIDDTVSLDYRKKWLIRAPPTIHLRVY